MSFLTGNALGTCACRMVTEAQMVFASVPYPVGYVKMPAGASYPIFEPWQPVAMDQCYLTANCVAVAAGGPTLTGSVSYSQLDGYRTETGDGVVYEPYAYGVGDHGEASGWFWVNETTVRQTWGDGGVVTITLSNPWTYEDALASAIDLLAAVDLLNPTRTYTAPDASPFHLKYPSETGAIGSSVGWYNNQVCISQNLHRAEDGTPGTMTTDLFYAGNNPYGWRPEASSYNTSGLVVTHIEDQGIMPNGFPFAMNGYIHSDGGSQSRLWVSKMAFRSPRRLNFKQIYLLNFEESYVDRVGFSVYHLGGDVTYVGQAPLLIYPGEHIFSHSDIPAGFTLWSNAPSSSEPAPSAGDSSTGAGGTDNPATL